MVGTKHPFRIMNFAFMAEVTEFSGYSVGTLHGVKLQ